MSFIRYNPKLKERARELRNNSTTSEIKLWKSLRAGQLLGYTFNRQQRLEDLGLTFIRFYDHDVLKHTEGVLFKIRKVAKKLEKKRSIPPSKGG